MIADLLSPLLNALHFAAEKHKFQRNPASDQIPYVNHLIQVTEALVRVGSETNVELLCAALLQDILEDTGLERSELETHFSSGIIDIVVELTDDTSLSYEDRNLRQIERIKSCSASAQKIRLADMTCNILELFTHPIDWPRARRMIYLQNAIHVVDSIRGFHPTLEAWFDQTVAWAKEHAAD